MLFFFVYIVNKYTLVFAEYTAFTDALKAHGFVVSLPDDQANALFSERIVNILRTLLDELAGHKED